MKYLIILLTLVFYLIAAIPTIAQPINPITDTLSDKLISEIGTNHHPVSTQNTEAQKLFDRGLNLIYAFNQEEAIHSFQQAAELDPKLAMAYWGIALALGPNINFNIESDQELAAYFAIQKALKLSKKYPISASEIDYIKALATRYTNNLSADLQKLAVDYKNAMGELVKKYPNDLDAATLYAESAMDLHPWQLWSNDGKPTEDTAEIIAVLESVLERNPNHIGANHYYIHAIEASPYPEKALPSANRLGKLAPGAGHLVHMPAHIYYNIGDYTKAAQANQNAIAVDKAYIEKYNVQGIYPVIYYNHNLDFLAIASSMAGNYEMAMKTANEFVNNILPLVKYVPMAEGYLATPLLIQLQFRDWNGILKTPKPDPNLPITTAFWHWAMAMANAANSNIELAKQQRQEFIAAKQIISPDSLIGLNSTDCILNIAKNLLNGQIARQKQEYPTAIKFFQKAIIAEDNLNYDEPPTWYIPSREFLGNLFLATHNYPEAETVFRTDLKKHPHYGRCLFGLHASLKKQGKIEEAKLVKADLKTAWKNSDTQIHLKDL